MKTRSEQMKLLKMVIAYVGGESLVCKALGISEGCINRNWISRGNIPSKYVFKLSELSGGRIKPEEFLNDNTK